MPGLLYVTAIVYSLFVYFGAEVWTERQRANLPMVFLINIPYLIIPLLLAWRLRRARPFDEGAGRRRD